jgi:hypothetical protein
MRLRFLILLCSFALLASQCSRKKERDKLQEVLGLQKMSDLATAEYVVTKIIKANDNKTWYKLGNRKILITCQASLAAGIDLSKLTEKDISINGKNISIVLPHATLLYININPEDIKTAYIDISPWRMNFTSQEKNQLAAQAETQIKGSVESLGILITAETNASIFIDNFLKSLGYKNIKINFLLEKRGLQ